MGLVYPFRDILGHKVPDLNGREQADTFCRQTLMASPAVVWALQCGSSVRREHNLRSDVETVVAYANHTKLHECTATTRGISRYAQECFLSWEPILINQECAQAGVHNLRPSFCYHLKEAAVSGGIIKGNPMDCIHMPSIEALRADILAYLNRKIGYFNSALAVVRDEEKRYHLCRKTLEVAYHICRKILRLAIQTLPDSGKEVVVTEYLKIAPDECKRLLRQLVELDQRYTAVLESQLENQIWAIYDAILTEIEEAAVLALEFAQLNALWCIELSVSAVKVS